MKSPNTHIKLLQVFILCTFLVFEYIYLLFKYIINELLSQLNIVYQQFKQFCACAWFEIYLS